MLNNSETPVLNKCEHCGIQTENRYVCLMCILRSQGLIGHHAEVTPAHVLTVSPIQQTPSITRHEVAQ